MRIFESMVVKRTMKATAKFINSKKQDLPCHHTNDKVKSKRATKSKTLFKNC